MTRFYIARHGNTFESYEEPTRIGEKTDIPLVSSGKKQADLLGKYFLETKGIIFSAAFSSPLTRAIETCERVISCQPSSLDIENLDILTEIDHGPDENKPEKDVLERIGRSAISLWDEKAMPPCDWVVNPCKRIEGWRKFFIQGAERYPNGNILLVTSNGAARFSLKANNKVLSMAKSLGSLKLRTGAFGCIEFFEESSASLDCWNKRPFSIVSSSS